jgi:hypothetical protein
MINRSKDFWETLCPYADAKIEELATDFENNKMSSKKFLRLCAHIAFDYPDADVATETLNKIFDFVLYVTNDNVERATELFNKYYQYTQLDLQRKRNEQNS